MKYKKTLKTLYAFIFTSIILFGVFLYANPVYSEDTTFTITFTCTSYSNGGSVIDISYSLPDSDTFISAYSNYTHGGPGTVTFSMPFGPGIVYRVYTRNSYRSGTGIPYTYYFYRVTTYSYNNSSPSYLSSSIDSPTVLDFSSAPNIRFFSAGSSSATSSFIYYYFTFDFPTPEPTAEPTPTPTPDLSYLLPNSDVSLPSLTVDNFYTYVDPVIIGNGSSSDLLAFAAPNVEIYGCYVGDIFYFFTKDDRAAANSVGLSQTDLMDRVTTIMVSNAITPYPLTGVKYGSFSSYTFTSEEKNTSLISFNSLSEAASFYDSYITEPIYTPTPSPDPTPTPTPTQDPLITEDNNFWDHMGNTASGLWSGLTSFVAGLYSNVVTRNLAIYIPIFALIVALLVYAIHVGGGHDD